MWDGLGVKYGLIIGMWEYLDFTLTKVSMDMPLEKRSEDNMSHILWKDFLIEGKIPPLSESHKARKTSRT